MIWGKSPERRVVMPAGAFKFLKKDILQEGSCSLPSDAPGEGGGSWSNAGHTASNPALPRPGGWPWTTKLSDIDERVVKIRGLWNTEPALAEPTGGRPWAAKLNEIDERVIKNTGAWNTELALAKPTGGRPWATKIERY